MIYSLIATAIACVNFLSGNYLVGSICLIIAIFCASMDF